SASDQPVTTSTSWTVCVPVGSSSSTPSVFPESASSARMAGNRSSGHSGGRPANSSSLAIGAGRAREPGIQALFGVAGRAILEADVAVVSAPIYGGQKIAVVDLAAPRLVPPGHFADLDVGDVGHVLGEGFGEIAFHDLQMVGVVLEFHGRAADRTDQLESERRVSHEVARVFVDVERFDQQGDAGLLG